MRLFFGLSLSPVLRAETERLRLCAMHCIPGRYSEASNHHITLAFLGDVEPNRLPDVQDVLARAASLTPAPTLTLSHAECFGRMENGILVLRLTSFPSLDPLHDALCSALIQADLPASDGPFAPHVTLARHAHVTAQALASLRPAPLCFSPGQAHVFLSARNAQNVLAYTPIASVPFKP